MKTLRLYRSRKRLLQVLMVAVCLLVLAYLMTEDWNEPNWLLIASLAFNIFAIGYQNWRYGRNLSLEMHRDKIVYRTMHMNEQQVIEVNDESEFSKDWKGIHIKNDKRVQSISLEFMGKKEGDRLYSEIRAFYG